jgi:hypothetical protein
LPFFKRKKCTGISIFFSSIIFAENIIIFISLPWLSYIHLFEKEKIQMLFSSFHKLNENKEKKRKKKN